MKTYILISVLIGLVIHSPIKAQEKYPKPRAIFGTAFGQGSVASAVTTTKDADTVAALTEETAIRETLMKYLDGWATGDTTLLTLAMHTSCHLKFFGNDKFNMVNKQEYLRFHKPHPHSADIKTSIEAINYTGAAAGAILKIENFKTRYTDYMNLLKINGQWYIVDKVSYAEPK